MCHSKTSHDVLKGAAFLLITIVIIINIEISVYMMVVLFRNAVVPFASSSVCWGASVNKWITSAMCAANPEKKANASRRKTFLV